MKSIIVGSILTGVTSTSVTNYAYIQQVFGLTTASTTEPARQMVVPCALTLSNMVVVVQTAPSSGKNYAFTVYKNGSATALTTTIADANTTNTDSTHSVSFSAGDTISLELIPTGTPTAPGNIYWNILADAGASNFAGIFGGSMSNPSTTLTNYMNIMGGSGTAWSVTEGDYQIVVPTSGTLKNLRVMSQNAPGAAKSYTYTPVKNGTPGALTAAISGTNMTGNDLSNTLSVSAGDTLTMQSVPAGTPTSPGGVVWGVEFDPTNPGESFYGYGTVTAPSAVATNYEQLIGTGRGSYNATESARQVMLGAYTLTAFYVKLGTAPGLGSNRTVTVRNAAAGTALTVAISDLATAGNITGQSVLPTSTQFQTLQSAITGTPAADVGGIHTGLLIYIAPSVVTNIGSTLSLMGVG